MVSIGQPAKITYTNYRGETAERTITPKRTWFGISDWHPEPQWFLTAFDHDKNADRDFALRDFGPTNLSPTPVAPVSPVEHQHTVCAGCFVDKPTPLRRDEMGGYVCLTCVDKRLDALSKELLALDATGKCGELVTVAYQFYEDLEWFETFFPDDKVKQGYQVRELCDRSQAVVLLAAERAAIPILKGTAFKSGDGWKDTTKEGEVCFIWNKMHSAPYAPGQYPRVGKEHWSASTENFTFEPATPDEVVKLFSDLEADNAALTARTKELEKSRAEILNQQDKGWRDMQTRAETLEAKLATMARLRDSTAPMTLDPDEWTATEEVLAHLLINVVGVPDDVPYTPDQAQEAIEKSIENLKVDNAALTAREGKNA